MKNAEDLNNLGMYMLHIFVMHVVSFFVKGNYVTLVTNGGSALWSVWINLV